MNDVPKDVIYRFAAYDALKVTAYILFLTITSITTMVITLVRVWPFGVNQVTVSLVAIVGLLTLIVILGARKWLTFARHLKGVKRFPLFKHMIYVYVIALTFLFICSATFSLVTIDIRSVAYTLSVYFFMLGGEIVAIIFGEYLQYRGKYPQREIQFLDYCNETVTEGGDNDNKEA